MYKPVEPIRCPDCGEIVKVNTEIVLTSYPPQYKWECPKCGKTGTVGSDDIITFENQTYPMTSGYIQKIDKPDPGVGITTTNADDITTIDITPAIYSTNTKCTICGEEFKFDGEYRICPKCREVIVKFREAVSGTTNAMPAGNKSTVNIKPENKSTATDSKSAACNIPAPQFIQQGWQCPKCGAILAPNQNYCPFCSKKESDWITTVGTGTQPFYAEWTNKDNLTPPSGQYINPNPNTAISLGDKLKTPNSDSITFTTPCDNIKVTI